MEPSPRMMPTFNVKPYFKLCVPRQEISGSQQASGYASGNETRGVMDHSRIVSRVITSASPAVAAIAPQSIGIPPDISTVTRTAATAAQRRNSARTGVLSH